MLDSFMLRSGYAELAKAVHSASGSVTTIFLFTRLWARTTHYKGLWWDDYILIAAWAFLLVGNGLGAASPSYGFNILEGTSHGWTLTFSSISLFYIAGGLAKIAFATTLLRLSAGGVRAVLYSIIAIVCVFTSTVAVVTWLDICETRTDTATIQSGPCVPINTLLWIHIGNCIATVCTDALLTYLPWRIVANIYIPSREKWATAVSMSLVGLAGIVCVTRAVMASHGQKLEKRHGRVDWSYGAVTIWCLHQAEAAIYIIAQTIPLLRVMLTSSGGSTVSRVAGSIAEISPASRAAKEKSPRVTTAGPDTIEETSAVELVRLPSGRIVRADSEEGMAFTASQPQKPSRRVETAVAPGFVVSGAQEQRASQASVDDEVHRIWADMGLSRRAWTESPSPPPGEARRGLPDTFGTTASA